MTFRCLRSIDETTMTRPTSPGLWVVSHHPDEDVFVGLVEKVKNSTDFVIHHDGKTRVISADPERDQWNRHWRAAPVVYIPTTVRKRSKILFVPPAPAESRWMIWLDDRDDRAVWALYDVQNVARMVAKGTTKGDDGRGIRRMERAERNAMRRLFREQEG